MLEKTPTTARIERPSPLKNRLLRMCGVVSLSVATLLSGCEFGPEKLGPTEIISVGEDQNATRVTVKYKDGNGLSYEESVHWSRKFYCGDLVVEMKDIQDGKFPSGPFDADAYRKFKANQ